MQPRWHKLSLSVKKLKPFSIACLIAPTAISTRAQRGIVFVDEVDKLKSISGESRATSGESVQHALLKIMEGAGSFKYRATH